MIRYPTLPWSQPGWCFVTCHARVRLVRRAAVLRNARRKERRFTVMRPHWDYREGMAAVRRLKFCVAA